MPSRPLFWLTISFMLGISAQRLFGTSLSAQTHYYALAAVILTLAMAVSLWPRDRVLNSIRFASSVVYLLLVRATKLGPKSPLPPFRKGGDPQEENLKRDNLHGTPLKLIPGARHIHLLPPFAIPALLFAVFGVWAAESSAPQFPQGLEPFLNGQPATFIAEVSASPEYFPDRTRTPLRLLWAITGDRKVPLNAGVLLGLSRKDPTRLSLHPASPSLYLNSPGPYLKSPGPYPASPGPYLVPGDRVLFRAALKRFSNYKNPGGFDYVLYQAGKGLNAQCFLKHQSLLVKLAPAPGAYAGSIINALRGRIELFRQKTLLWSQNSMDPSPAAFYAAMILGYKNLLDTKWQDHIHQTGLNHLLSVSGLHIGMVSMFVFLLVRLAVRSLCPSILNRTSDKMTALWPSLACAVLYAFLAGFGAPTIWRSILTLAVFFGAAFRYRKADSLTVLALAALLILILDPGNLWQLPFQLTFACVLAIIVIYPRFRGIRLHRIFPILAPGTAQGKIISHFEDAFWISIAVNIALLPLIIFYFDGFALAGIVANIFLIPYTGFVILPLGLFSVLLFALSQTLAYPVILVLNYLLWGCLHFIEWFSRFTWSYFWTGSMSPAWLLSIYAALGLLFAPFSRKLKVAALSALTALVCVTLAIAYLYAGPNATGELKVDVIDVGQGSSALVRLPSGERVLVDGGGALDGSYDIGRAVLAPFLWHEGIRRLDFVVLSHDHPDHGLGLRFILSHFDVGAFWTSAITDDKTGVTHCGLSEIASNQKIRVRTFPDLFTDVQIGRVRLRLLHPTADFLAKGTRGGLNDLSLVLEISCGQTRVILPGDIGRNVEDLIIPALEGPMQTLLVAAHHGSRNSNSAEFLDALSPIAVVFSCGYENQFGFPAPAAVQRCAARNIPMYRTDIDGAVHAVSDGLKWTITTESDRNSNAQKNRER